MAAFEADEHRTGVGDRPFHAQIVLQSFDDFLRQWQESLLVSFAEDTYLRISQMEIVKLESQDLAGTQTIEQHQAHQGEIAKGVKAAPECSDVVRGEGHDHAPRLL